MPNVVQFIIFTGEESNKKIFTSVHDMFINHDPRRNRARADNFVYDEGSKLSYFMGDFSGGLDVLSRLN